MLAINGIIANKASLPVRPLLFMVFLVLSLCPKIEKAKYTTVGTC